MEEINAVELLREELKGTSPHLFEVDEVHLKVNAIHRLKTVLLSISQDEIKSDLFPFLQDLIDTE